MYAHSKMEMRRFTPTERVLRAEHLSDYWVTSIVSFTASSPSYSPVAAPLGHAIEI
jgi:hypothetical protein